MEYPIIHIKKEIPSYKHCAKGIALLINVEASETFLLEQNEKKHAYLQSIINKLQETIANMFVVSQGIVVFDQEQCISVYKGNLEKQALLAYMSSLAKELYEYTNAQVQLKYALSPVMLLVENKTPGMFSAAKVGSPIMQCNHQWQEINIDKARSMGKYLATFDEFVKQYEEPQFDYYI